MEKFKDLFINQSDNTHYYFPVMTNKGNNMKDLRKITINQSPETKNYMFIGFVAKEIPANTTNDEYDAYVDINEQPPVPIMENTMCN